MTYFHQEKNFGLGNFVMATPMLKFLYTKNKSPIPVFFHDSNIASIYKDAEFLTILKKQPKTKPLFGSTRCPKRRPSESDSEAYCRIAGSKGSVPPTYVDKPLDDSCVLPESSKKHVAIFHGCLGKGLKEKKDIGKSNRQMVVDYILKSGMIPVLIGTQKDFDWYWSHNDVSDCISYIGKLNLRKSVCILSQCDAFISNDTGLYHVAGGLNMTGLVLWKRTDLVKNMTTCKKIIHSQNQKADQKEFEPFVKNFCESINEKS